MLSAFYKPDTKRYKILYEAKAFPSDQYAFEGQARLHGYKPEDALLALAPRKGEFCLRTEDILKTIEEQGDSIAVVIFSGIQYYTGQLFEIEKITKAARAKGCIVGWDCAHAGGNVPLKLHDWDVDFAVFCTYKYMNSGPGAIGAIFVNSKYADGSWPRQAGWWGNKPESRFEMRAQFDPAYGAAGFKISNPTVLSVACLHESLKLFAEYGGIEKLRERSISMTNLLWDMLTASKFYVPVEKLDNFTPTSPAFTIITPSNPQERGAQLSLLFLPLGSGVMQKVFTDLESRAIIGDERQPDVIRLAPNHFYNTHADVVKAVEALEESLLSVDMKNLSIQNSH
jgi:kynureninase